MNATFAPPDPAAAPPTAPPPADAQAAVPPPGRPRRRMSGGHIAAVIIGALLLLPGLGMLAGGGTAAIGQAVATDDDGYFEFTIDRLETDGVALAAFDIVLDADDGTADWLLDWVDLDVRLRVDGAQDTDEVFVGIARSADVERYLEGTSHREIDDVEGRTPVYRTVNGSRSIEPPLRQDFWEASASGSDTQELEWDARGGRWAVVVMNADGAPVVAADVEVGARSGLITPIAVTLLVLGGAVTLVAIVLIVLGARGSRAHDAELSPATSR